MKTKKVIRLLKNEIDKQMKDIDWRLFNGMHGQICCSFLKENLNVKDARRVEEACDAYVKQICRQADGEFEFIAVFEHNELRLSVTHAKGDHDAVLS